MSGAEQSLLFTRIECENDRCVEPFWISLREHACQLDDCRGSRPVVVRAGRVGSRIEAVGAADAGVIMPSDDYNATCIPAGEPCENVHDVDGWTLRVASHLGHRR